MRTFSRIAEAAAIAVLTALGLAALDVAAAASGPAAPADGPAYTAKGELVAPKDYRRWVYLSSGYDMSYLASQTPGMHMFDNVFVNPSAYAAFLKTGTWPDKTVMVLEPRGAVQKGSINRSGAFQGEVMGGEVHVKDTARFSDGGWAFFDVTGETGQLIPRTAACYSCHAAHAAVDTTFVQFYPTLKPIAVADHTLSPAYLAAEAAAPKL